MTIKQALKEKNRLAKLIEQAYQDAAINNSIPEGNPRKYSVNAKLEEGKELTNKLVDLKAAIHRANSPVYGKIFLMAELKGTANNLRRIPTNEGSINSGYGSAPVVYTVEVDVVKRDQLIREIEDQIEAIQDELDVHNALVTI